MLLKVGECEIFLTRNKAICDDKLPLIYFKMCDNVIYIIMFGIRLTIET